MRLAREVMRRISEAEEAAAKQSLIYFESFLHYPIKMCVDNVEKCSDSLEL
jgi:hypothetical protein